MRRKRSIRYWVLGFTALFCLSAEAATFTRGPILTSAVVPNMLSLNVLVLDAATDAPLSSLDFGRLSAAGNELGSTRAFRVLLQVNAQGSPYEVRQEASPLQRSGGEEMLPLGAFLAQPLYLETDNAGQTAPAGARLGAADSVENLQSVYLDPSGSNRTVSVLYQMAPAGGQAIPVHQRSGDYTGTIQYTLVTS